MKYFGKAAAAALNVFRSSDDIGTVDIAGDDNDMQGIGARLNKRPAISTGVRQNKSPKNKSKPMTMLCHLVKWWFKASLSFRLHSPRIKRWVCGKCWKCSCKCSFQQGCLQQRIMSVLPWTARSANLNLIENLFGDSLQLCLLQRTLIWLHRGP